MAIEIRLPKLGMSMEAGTLKEWFIEDGGNVEQGALLYSVETDKSVIEVEAPVGGTLEIIGAVDTDYEIGDLIARIG